MKDSVSKPQDLCPPGKISYQEIRKIVASVQEKVEKIEEEKKKTINKLKGNECLL